MAFGLLLVIAGSAGADGVAYVGELESDGAPANGSYDFRVRLYDGADPYASEQIGNELQIDAVKVVEGRFRLGLDLATTTKSLVSGELWLEIEVARHDRVGGFIRLEPRQQLDLDGLPVQRADVPGGAVVFFDLTECPTGWSEFAPARGRVVVGLQPGGTLEGTVGMPLSNLQSLLHSHQMPTALVTETAGTHNHVWSIVAAAGSDVQWQTYDQNGSLFLAFAWGNGIGNDGSGVYPMASPAGRTYYTARAGEHTHNIAAHPTNQASGTLPYLQLLACQKD
jgi:hypothetical protein